MYGSEFTEHLSGLIAFLLFLSSTILLSEACAFYLKG
jgi:hypothetical protein